MTTIPAMLAAKEIVYTYILPFYKIGDDERDAILIQDIVAIIENHQTLEGLNPNVTPGLALLDQYAGREQRLRNLLPELEALAYTAITELANENEGHWAPIMEITNKFRAILNEGEK